MNRKQELLEEITDVVLELEAANRKLMIAQHKGMNLSAERWERECDRTRAYLLMITEELANA